MPKQNGTSFLELLISLMIMSFMVLGMNLFLLDALRKTQVAYEYAIAIQQLSVITEMLAARGQANNGEVTEYWNKQLSEVLPEGRGVIEGQYPHYVISIFWGNINETGCDKNRIGRNGCVYITT